jgi:serralysin
MTGGAGADTFNVFAGGGNDVVTDFNAAEGDKVHIEGDVPFTVAQVGADVVVTLAGHETLTLQHVMLSSLTDGWITH